MSLSDFDSRLAALSPDKRALLLQKLDAMRGAVRHASVLPRGHTRLVRATPAQEQLWLLHRLHPESPVYNVPALVRLEQTLDLRAVDAAMEAIVARHESLRTVFVEESGHVWQKVLPSFSPELVYVDLRAVPAASRALLAQREIARDGSAAFDLARGPLLRLLLLHLGDSDWLLAPTFHHIIVDAWSVGIFERELRALIAVGDRRPAELTQLPIQYPDYAEWLRSPQRIAEHSRQIDYWRRKLAAPPTPTQWPADRRAAGRDVSGGAMEYFRVTAAAAQQVRAFSAPSTPFVVLVAAFFALLYRVLGERDLTIGSPVSVRRHRETEGLIGLFLNVLSLRAGVRGDATFRQLVSDLHATVTEALDHSDVTAHEVLEALGLDRAPAFSPPHRVTFGLQTDAGGGMPREGSADGNGTAKFDLSMILAAGDEYAGVIEYRTGLYEPATIRRLASMYVTLLEAALAAPETAIASLPLYPPEERDTMLRRSWGPALSAEPEGFLERFRAWAARQPDTPAILGDAAITYRELDTASDVMADQLSGLGVVSGDIVAVVAERGADWVIAFLAVLKGGGVYLSIDPAYPVARIDYVLQDSGARAAIAAAHVRSPRLEGLPRLRPGGSPSGGPPGNRRMPNRDDGAYAIYTSGSTGPAKAAVMSHAGLAGLASAQAATFGPQPGDVVLSLSALSFDASVFELSMALAHGAALCLAPPDDLVAGPRLAATLARTRTTILTTPPSILSLVPPGVLPDLRIVIAAGEPCPAALVDRWQPGRRFFNAYGPTECTVWATVHECSAGQPDPPLGTPIPGAAVYITDGHDHLCPDGVAGELVIGGAMVGQGYVNRPEMTADKFRVDPFGPAPGRVYLSGDRGRRRPDGAIEFLGRTDRQVKVRGFRVEPGEVEFALTRLPQVAHCAIVAVPDDAHGTRLDAYVVPTGDASAASIRTAITALLPSFLVPSRWHLVDAIPLTPNGKTDYGALQAHSETKTARAEAGQPLRGDVEQRLATVWRNVLDVDTLFADSDFFALGGHSLLVARLLVGVSDAFGIELTLKDVFDLPVLRALASHIATRVPSATPAAPIRRAARTPFSAVSIATTRVTQP